MDDLRADGGKRVVVTGMGIVCPLGVGTNPVWSRLRSGESGIRAIEGCDVSDLPCQIAGEVPRGQALDEFDPGRILSAKDQKKVDDFILYSLQAASEAVASSGLVLETEEQRIRTGVMIGSGIGGLKLIESCANELHERGPRRVTPFFIPGSLSNSASGQVGMLFGIKGPTHAVVTACATGTHAIGDAARLVSRGDADVMLAGSAEGAVCRLGLAGFASLRALSTGYNDRPTEASRPWDRDRDGFVMAEGAGVVVVESLEHARKRGAPILAEVLGYGLSGDAYHATAPAPDGGGAYRSMKAAMEDAGVGPEGVDYINAHGTSTPLGDEIELGSIRRYFGHALDNISVSSTKSAIGHLLGGAGSVEAIFAILAMRDGLVPPTLNLHNPSDGCKGFDLTPLKAKERSIRTALSNSFGFGGTNACLVFRAAP